MYIVVHILLLAMHHAAVRIVVRIMHHLTIGLRLLVGETVASFFMAHAFHDVDLMSNLLSYFAAPGPCLKLDDEPNILFSDPSSLLKLFIVDDIFVGLKESEHAFE